MSDNPWSDLIVAAQPQTGKPTLYLEPGVKDKIRAASETYVNSLQKLKADTPNDTTTCFGTPKNPIAKCLEQAFNSRGTALTNYLTQQVQQVNDCVETVSAAPTAIQATDNA
jgi:hypothetical protein